MGAWDNPTFRQTSALKLQDEAFHENNLLFFLRWKNKLFLEK